MPAEWWRTAHVGGDHAMTERNAILIGHMMAALSGAMIGLLVGYGLAAGLIG